MSKKPNQDALGPDAEALTDSGLDEVSGGTAVNNGQIFTPRHPMLLCRKCMHYYVVDLDKTSDPKCPNCGGDLY